jgi:hypothetical protein
MAGAVVWLRYFPDHVGRFLFGAGPEEDRMACIFLTWFNVKVLQRT